MQLTWFEALEADDDAFTTLPAGPRGTLSGIRILVGKFSDGMKL